MDVREFGTDYEPDLSVARIVCDDGNRGDTRKVPADS